MATSPSPFNDETQVNTTDAPPGGPVFSDQTDGQAVGLPDGGYLVVWTDPSGAFNPGGSAILGQRYDAAGARVGGEFLVSQFDDGEGMRNPAVTALEGGRVAIAFGDADEGDLYVQRYDGNLNLLGIDTIDTGVATDGSVAPLPGGGYVVTYTEFGTDIFDQDEDRVMARIVSANGVVGAAFAVHDGGVGSYAAEAAALSDGNFVVAYQDDVNSSLDDVRYRIFEADGTPVGASVLVAAGAGQRIEPDATALRYGGFVVAWGTQLAVTDPPRILASVYDDAGNVVAADIAVSDANHSRRVPTTLGLADGGFLVTWERSDDNGSTNLTRARQFDPTGNGIGDEFTAHVGFNQGPNNAGAGLLTSDRLALAIDHQGVNLDFDVFTRIWQPGREVAELDGVLWRHDDGRVETATHDPGTAPATWEIESTGDFDADGDSDILWRHEDGQVVTWELQDGQFVTNHSIEFAATSWQIGATGDVDADGDDDIIWRHQDGQVVTWELQDGGFVQTHSIESASGAWSIDGTGDFDGDSDADILWRHDEGAVVTWELEDGEFVQSHSIEFASAFWSIEGTGDFDGDGDDDIVWHHRDGAVVTWEMQAGDLADVHSIADAAGDWDIQGVHDFNGDGNADLLWRHAEGLVVTWNLDGGELLQVDNHGVTATTWQIRGTGEFDLA